MMSYIMIPFNNHKNVTVGPINMHVMVVNFETMTYKIKTMNLKSLQDVDDVDEGKLRHCGDGEEFGVALDESRYRKGHVEYFNDREILSALDKHYCIFINNLADGILLKD